MSAGREESAWPTRRSAHRRPRLPSRRPRRRAAAIAAVLDRRRGPVHGRTMDRQRQGRTREACWASISPGGALSSFLSLAGLIVLVFFLARLTGDPTNLYLPLDASLEARAEFAEKHGFNDPLLEQFGRFLARSRPLRSRATRSARRGRRSRSCSRRFRRRSKLAAITMTAALGLAVRGRRARGLPAGRRVRPDRERDLAGRRQRARLLGRDHRHPAVRGDARLAADLGHRHALALDPADRGAADPAVRAAGPGRARRDDRRRCPRPTSRPRAPRACASGASSSSTRSATRCCR